MEADPELIEVYSPKCTGHPHLNCVYFTDQPRDDECDHRNTPCNDRPIIFVPKMEYLTWKLTQS